MAPLPEEGQIVLQDDVKHQCNGGRVVISGMSGLYPKSHHVRDLTDILYSKVNPINETQHRYQINNPEVAHHTGTIPDLDKFDAQFFKTHYHQAINMDPMSRKILEQTFQAIYDAGVSPEHLSGKKVGVFIGTCFSETEKACFYVATQRNGFGISGCNRSMFANRISYWLNAKGPSLSIDSSCCSSTTSLEQAYLAMGRGECEAAVVGGAYLCLHPQSSVHFGRIITMSKDGKSKSFDENADGCVKSEAINVLFLQKAKDALRIYAEVLHVKTEFTSLLEGDTGPRYGFYRNPSTTAEFLKSFYKEAVVSPRVVEYVEAFGSGVSEADKSELDAIGEVFCNGRDEPLFIGSVKSNIGYSEAASGISAITKVLIGYQKGQIAANLHCEKPRQDVAALRDGRMKVVTEHQPFSRSYTAVNSMSVTGVNAHVLLHGRYKPKDLDRYKSSIPRLVTASGRHESAVKRILDDLKDHPIDPEQIALLNNIHEDRISGHLGRGFVVLDTNEENKTVSLCEKADYYDDAKRQLWFVYSGMGSQWAGMGTQLMRIPIFAAAMERCRIALEPKGVNIVDIITSPDKTTFDNILNSFVGIAAIQIGLTDILRELGLVPDKIIGHSVGELGCAYADGCFTAEEMILSAYSRGLVSVQTPFIKGSMAAVGVGYQKISQMCPPEIEVACHNGVDSSTISGPAEVMSEFVAKLTAQRIFAKEVPCSNIAYHSRYIAEAGPGLLKYLSEVIKDPKPRSDRWVSTSVPQDQWEEPRAKYSSAEYHTNNLLNPVLFEETSRLIPPGAVLVEIAPHGLLQAILKRSLPETCRNIPLTRRSHPDNAVFLLEAVGKLYMEGYNPKVAQLYPKVEFPVSSETPGLSHMIEWAHTEKWMLPLYSPAHRKMAATCNFIMSVHDEEHKYLRGHVVRGQNLFPFAGALVAVWDTLAMTLGATKKGISVQFSDVHLYCQPLLHDRRQLRLSVALHRGSGYFEVMDDNSKMASGYVTKDISNVESYFNVPLEETTLDLTSDDVYHMFYERDFRYSNEFRSICNANSSLTQGHIHWDKNWVTFLDGMLQLNTLQRNTDATSAPALIRRLTIDVNIHMNDKVIKLDHNSVMKVEHCTTQDLTRCGGILIENIKFKDLPILRDNDSSIHSLKLVSRFPVMDMAIRPTLQIYLQIVAENVNKDCIKVVEIMESEDSLSVYDEIRTLLDDIPELKLNFWRVTKNNIGRDEAIIRDADAVLLQSLSTDDALCRILHGLLNRNIFLINSEEKGFTRERPANLYTVVSATTCGQLMIELVKWKPIKSLDNASAVFVKSQADLKMLASSRAMLGAKQMLLITSSYPPINGLKELVKKWRKEEDRNQVYLLVINHKLSERQDIDRLPELDLAYNVLDQGDLKGEYYIPLTTTSIGKRGAKLQSTVVGDVESLQWVESPELTSPGVKVNVCYAGINDMDVKRATAQVPFKTNDTQYGMDFSGVTDSGERVMGVIAGGAISSRVIAQRELLWPVPAHWSLEDAATVPLPYAHAFYCLVIKSHLYPGMSILIHGGAGALGQALIAIALAFHCQVFTTVSDVRKKQFLRKLFPELKDSHIGNSRNNSFSDMVMLSTKGKGCKIVVGCVKGDLKNACFTCCGFSGKTIDTTLIQTSEKFNFGMYNLTMERNYIALDFSSLFSNRDISTMKQIQLMMSEGIAKGYVRPLSRVCYEPLEVSRAFRLLAGSRHRGRVLLKLKDDLPSTEPRLDCSPDHTQLLISTDDDVFGTQVADRLVERGAKKIRYNVPKVSSYLKLKAQSWESHGVDVKISSYNIDSKNAASLLSDCNTTAPVEGVYIISTGLEESEVSKVDALVAHMDVASRKICPTLRHFAVISSQAESGKQTCLQRGQDKLASAMVHLPCIEKASNVSIGWRLAVDAVERGLTSAERVMTVLTRPAMRPTLVQQVFNAAGLTIPRGIEDSTTLEDIGIEQTTKRVVCSLLQNLYGVHMEEEDVGKLTLGRIQEIEESLFGAKLKEIKGLNTFLSYVDTDEIQATTEVVLLPTMIYKANMRGDEFFESQSYLYMIPGLEGHNERFRMLCERLKIAAIVLQPGVDKLNETIQEMAQRYTKVILSKTDVKAHFHLLGYESGVMVALEVAAILEQRGINGTVFCLGSTPEELKTVLERELTGIQSDEDLQNVVATHMFSLMSHCESDFLHKSLQNAHTWNEKLDTCVRELRGRVPHSSQYARTLIDAAYTRIKYIRSYTPEIKSLRSRLVLLRAANTKVTNETLQRRSQQPIAVFELDTPLPHLANDIRCSAIINENLDTEILDLYDKKNLCESYLLNADTFMMAEAIND